MRDGYIPVDGAELYVREIGHGQPIIVLHGGPEFDHSYLLPDMDRLADSFRLIYYDQRGRGKSAGSVRPEEVSLTSELDDLERLRLHFDLERVALLGHSWGALLAAEYAARHPGRVSHLILMNTAPVSHDDLLLLRRERRARAGADLDELRARSIDAGYQEGDPDAFAEFLRIHFRATLRRPEQLDRLIGSLRSSFTREGILKARAIDERLSTETLGSIGYSALPGLGRLNIPTLVIHGDYDFIPIECAEHVAAAIPGARLVVLRDCGHFAYLECPHDVRQELTAFFHRG